LPDFIVAYVGDTLWILLVFLIIGFLFFTQPAIKTAVLAIFEFFMEITSVHDKNVTR
jgi:hypothetical protein